MSDIVERLRAGVNFYAESSLWYDRDLADSVDEAADEIERLRALIATIIDRRDTYGWSLEADAAIDAARGEA